MPDLLVRLYSIKLADLKRKADDVGVSIRPALAPELHLIVSWVRERFSENWASEVAVAFSRQPVACLIAVEGGKLLGFACYDTTARGFFGPTGVDPDARGKGIGLSLFSACLQTMRGISQSAEKA